MELSHVQLIVYDLDGTLYEDTHHFDFYAEQLKRRLPADVHERYQAEYEAARQDRHTLRIGRTYDATNDLILVQIRGDVSEGYRWDGTPVAADELAKLYPNGVTVNMETIFSVGDLWWVPSCIARHYGLQNAEAQEAFLATREFMMGPDFHMNPIPGLLEAITTARENGVKQVLVTNSPQPDSEKILEKIGLLHAFDDKVFNAKKPTGTKAAFERIRDAFGIPFTGILSVGDNWVNEILPANELGCQTVYIDPHDIGSGLEADRRVASMQDVLPLIQQSGR